MNSTEMVCGLLRKHISETAVPASQEMNDFVAEQAPGTAAHAAIEAFGCGFLMGAQYIVTVLESGKMVGVESMKDMMIEGMELALQVKEA